MPRFYVDTSDQIRFVKDEDGLEFDDIEAAMNGAADALSDMAHDTSLWGGSRSFIEVIRDEHGRTLAQATMSFGITLLPDRRSSALAGPS